MNTSPQMDAYNQFCPNVECQPRGQVGQKNIVGHDSKRREKLNTSFIERFNETIRECFAPIVRKCRYLAAKTETVHRGSYLIGSVYILLSACSV